MDLLTAHNLKPKATVLTTLHTPHQNYTQQKRRPGTTFTFFLNKGILKALYLSKSKLTSAVISGPFTSISVTCEQPPGPPMSVNHPLMSHSWVGHRPASPSKICSSVTQDSEWLSAQGQAGALRLVGVLAVWPSAGSLLHLWEVVISWNRTGVGNQQVLEGGPGLRTRPHTAVWFGRNITLIFKIWILEGDPQAPRVCHDTQMWHWHWRASRCGPRRRTERRRRSEGPRLTWKSKVRPDRRKGGWGQSPRLATVACILDAKATWSSEEEMTWPNDTPNPRSPRKALQNSSWACRMEAPELVLTSLNTQALEHSSLSHHFSKPPGM